MSRSSSDRSIFISRVFNIYLVQSENEYGSEYLLDTTAILFRFGDDYLRRLAPNVCRDKFN